MLISRLVIAMLGGLLLTSGSLSSQADSDRYRDTRSRLMQHDDRGRHAPYPHGWYEPRMQRDYRYRGRGAYEHRGSYWRWDRRPSWDRDWRGERFYPRSPFFDAPHGYPPPGEFRPDFPARHNPHPPGIYWPLHDNGLQRPMPR